MTDWGYLSWIKMIEFSFLALFDKIEIDGKILNLKVVQMLFWPN